MVEKEKGYVRENYEAQLNNLQSQINPHFLYNTLDNINQLAMIHEVEEISTLSVGLAKLLDIIRATVKMKQPLKKS